MGRLESVRTAPIADELMRVAFIIVAYNSAAELSGCLDSIKADSGRDCQTIVVDNASPDDSRAVAASHGLEPQIVVSERNLGFGGGCNLGASEAHAEALFFLNPDARLTPGTTAFLSSALAADEKLGVVAPRVVDPAGESRAGSAGAEPSLRSSLAHFLCLARIPGLGRHFQPVYMSDPARRGSPDWVSGAAMLVRSAAYRQVAGFDARLFMYMEDVDLCRRLREAGWGIAYEPAAIVEHTIGHSQSDDQAERWYSAYHRYIACHHGGIRARAASLGAALGMGLRAVAYVRSRPVNSRRMAKSARAALRFAISPRRPEERPAPATESPSA